MVGGRVVALDVVDVNVGPDGDVRRRRADGRAILEYLLARRDRAARDLVPDWQIGRRGDAGALDHNRFSRTDPCGGDEDIVRLVEEKETPVRVAAHTCRSPFSSYQTGWRPFAAPRVAGSGVIANASRPSRLKIFYLASRDHLSYGLPMVSLVRSTLAEQAYEALQDRIVSGVLPAGHRLRAEELADSLAISQTPVKEALALLERDGLVEGASRRGSVVRRFSLADVEEIYAARMLLELNAAETGLAAGRRRNS
jgi:DNA-binding transcriptional regulator YhcF (GntR family)